MKIRTVLVYSIISCLLTISFPATAQNILASSKIKHAFSDPATQDIFNLTLTGTSLLKSKATFEIFNAKGLRLYQEKFDGLWLLNELEVDAYNMNIRQQEDYLRKRVKEFFDEKNFLKPAIGSKDVTESDYSDLIIWNEIRANRKAIGFSYLLSYENHRKIAWSNKLKKVVEYWGCC